MAQDFMPTYTMMKIATSVYNLLLKFVACEFTILFIQNIIKESENNDFFFSNKAAIGVEISGKSRFWFQYDCKSKLQPMDNKTLIHLQCESSTNREIRIPEESTIQCLKTVEDPKKRLVIVAHKQLVSP